MTQAIVTSDFDMHKLDAGSEYLLIVPCDLTAEQECNVKRAIEQAKLSCRVTLVVGLGHVRIRRTIRQWLRDLF